MDLAAKVLSDDPKSRKVKASSSLGPGASSPCSSRCQSRQRASYTRGGCRRANGPSVPGHSASSGSLVSAPAGDGLVARLNLAGNERIEFGPSVDHGLPPDKDFDNLTRNALAFLRLASIRLMLRKLCYQ